MRHGVLTERGSSYGNSLNALDGWSTTSPLQRQESMLGRHSFTEFFLDIMKMILIFAVTRLSKCTKLPKMQMTELN